MAAKIGNDGGPVPAVTRAVAILDILADNEGLPLSVSEIARKLGLPKSSTANLCVALVGTGLAARSDAGFTLGRKLVELGGRYLSTVDEIHEFYELCRRAPVCSRETVRVAILDGLDVLYLARYDGTQPLRLTANIGDRFPATCTATGKALLATLDPAVVMDRLRGTTTLPALTNRSITTVPELLAELDQTRKRGYSIDDEETTPGVACFAVPVGGEGGPARFAISVTLLQARLDDAVRDALLTDLRTIAAGMGNPMQPAGRVRLSSVG